MLAGRNLAFRTRGVQIMVLCALVLRPLPPEVADRIAAYARELLVDEKHDRRGATLRLRLARARRGRLRAQRLHLHVGRRGRRRRCTPPPSWHRPGSSRSTIPRWPPGGPRSATCPPGTLGRGVWELYRARGLQLPGLPGSAPPLLAQHDWVHVLADFGTTVECELEVFAFISRANDDMRGFSLLAMVVSLFETGYLRTGAGLFEYDLGPPVRRRGHGHPAGRRHAARCAVPRPQTGDAQHRLPAPRLVRARRPPGRGGPRRFHVTAKSAEAVAAGSVTPASRPASASSSAAAGQALAEREGRPYEELGAEPA